MNINFYLEKLNHSNEFKKFMKENSTSFLCSGFFVIDKGKKEKIVHFDYTFPESDKIFSFQLNGDIKIVPIDKLEDKNIVKISKDFDFELEEIESIIIDEMEKRDFKSKIQKIILSLQEVDGKLHLIGTVFISILGLLKINISLPEKEIIELERKSLFDIVKVKKKE